MRQGHREVPCDTETEPDRDLFRPARDRGKGEGCFISPGEGLSAEHEGVSAFHKCKNQFNLLRVFASADFPTE